MYIIFLSIYLNRTPISLELINFAVDSINAPKSPPFLPLPNDSADLRNT